MVNMPSVGYGTFQLRQVENVHLRIETAIKTGYRLFDLADCYRNSNDICKMLTQILPKYNLSRKDIFLTSKIAPKDQGAVNASKACEKILNDCEVLGEKYLDLVLIHWPGTAKVKHENELNRVNRLETWETMTEYFNTGWFCENVTKMAENNLK